MYHLSFNGKIDVAFKATTGVGLGGDVISTAEHFLCFFWHLISVQYVVSRIAFVYSVKSGFLLMAPGSVLTSLLSHYTYIHGSVIFPSCIRQSGV